MVRAGDASTVQGSLTLSPTLASITEGWLLSILNLQSPQAQQKVQKLPRSAFDLHHKAFLITSLIFLPSMGKGGLCAPARALKPVITNIHSQRSEKSSLHQTLLQFSTAWRCAPASQLNPFKTATLFLIASLWITA